MHHALGRHLIASVAVVAGVFAVAPVATPAGRARAVRLTAVDADPLGGTALVMGGSTIAVPPQRYVDAVDDLFLKPNGFDGTAQGLFTPEGLYPLTGVKSLMLDPSVAQGQQILDSTILRQLDGGAAGPHDPLWVFGWSQSAIISSLVMSQLHDQHVPSDDVHFVLTGDVSAPAGGLLERFHVPIDGQDPTVPALGITFSGSTPSDLYPTDIYTTEYDLFADFPRYPINFLSDLNAYLGIIEHGSYPVLSADQVTDAIELTPADPDSLTHYYMIPTETLPLLAPLQLIPFIGNPLYDLLEPDTRILVNLGYGSIDQGWDPGPPDVPAPFELFPTDLDWGRVFTALAQGVPQGIEAAVKDLLNPSNYDLSNLLHNSLLTMLVNLMHTLGFTDATDVSQLLDLPTLLEMARNALSVATGFPTPDVSLFSSSPTEIVNMLTGTLSADYSALLPIADTANTLLTTIPSVLGSFVTDRLADGDLLGALGDPIAAGVGLIPFALIFGAGVPIFEAATGSLVNFADLIGLGD